MNSLLDDITSAFKKRDLLIKLILINIFVFIPLLIIHVILYLFNQNQIFEILLDFISLPANLNKLALRFWTVFTYSFVHVDVIHIFFNLLVLYWFGHVVLDLVGEKKVLSLYILGGLAGAVFFVAGINLFPGLKHYQNSYLIGCSACVYALVVGAATLSPNYRFFLIFLGPIKIKYLAAIYILLSFAQTMGNNPGGNLAHLGGALMGYIYITQLKKGNDLGKFLWRLAFNFRKLTELIFRKNKAQYTDKFNKTSYKSIPDEEEIDRILDKINLKGYSSLTKEEKEKLKKASQN